MSRAVLALGANLGDREATLRAALRGLGERLVAVSSGYQTPPWGDPDQPPYLNAVAVVEDDALDADGWLALAHRLETAGGRIRDPARRYGPRTLDVDVIAVWRTGSGAGREPVVRDDPALTLPHPRAHLRAFVLVPWAEIEPDAQLPGHGPITDLLGTEAVAADVPGVTRLGPLTG
ncbi:2-amino-4-hydroxy-6-hydroxymethyldihydropteridine diphosphokinase [Actinocatenispora thailandica]|uniref:2-amino-4-hydroxy-6-hydroxymethyldihydropteridine diphosphokinase n=1 Tax=Actinocatenispora thailandica TaxID=227318 RepID=A0A7R7DL00_9ACTN|nr:2-amino-4-hydroxy-6-hydroxymethyldihydropteridine diphosphokinase [Actinocatenispora thailandica]BCJ33538.1 2-amino-4-hydroxy-6-hydroxymethyldihydropteridine diphosphokinase [Actinocatenispora thailandica]